MIHYFALSVTYGTKRIQLHLFLHKLSRVGKIFEHALHRKVRTFGGVLMDHTDFHKRPSAEAIEWLPSDRLSTRCATPYTNLTEKDWNLFSFHTNMSLACKLVKGMLKILAHVWFSNQYFNLALSQCFLSSSTNSLTFNGLGPFLQNDGGRGSHLWLTISIEDALPTIHFNPSSIISRACSRLLHTYDGLLPSSASKKE